MLRGKRAYLIALQLWCLWYGQLQSAQAKGCRASGFVSVAEQCHYLYFDCGIDTHSCKEPGFILSITAVKTFAYELWVKRRYLCTRGKPLAQLNKVSHFKQLCWFSQSIKGVFSKYKKAIGTTISSKQRWVTFFLWRCKWKNNAK